MPDPTGPYAVIELCDALVGVTAEGRRELAALAPARFFAAQGGKWSPAEHVRHLRKASAPLVSALRLPAWALMLLFGRRRGPASSRAFAALEAEYRGALAAGGQAGRYAPSPEAPPRDPEQRQTEILNSWQATNRAVVRALARWSEARVDAAQLPHPLLGRLSVREMAAFTVFHTSHHLRLVRARLAAGA